MIPTGLRKCLQPFFFALMAGALFFSCSKEDDEEVRPPLSNISALLPFLEQHRPAAQIFQVSLLPATITGSRGTELILPANSLQFSGGGTLTGTAEIEMIELFERGDMILWQLPTVANGRLLATAGQLYLRATQQGTPLRFVNATLHLPQVDSIASTETSLVYKAVRSTETGVNWIRPTNSDSSAVAYVPADSLGSFGPFYRVNLPQDTLGWIGISRQFNQTGPGRAINGRLQGLDNYEGFIVYCVYRDIRGVSPFSTHYSGEIYSQTSVPDDLPVTIVAIGNQNGRFYYGSKSFTTGPAEGAPQIPVAEISETDLLANIHAL